MLHPPWSVGDISLLWLPSALLGVLFVSIFSLQGLSAQRAGAARTTIAGRMSLVLTVLGIVLLFHERITMLSIIGIGVAIVGLLLTTASSKGETDKRSWILPSLIFLGCGAADVIVNAAQRVRTTSLNEAAFTTMCFGGASTVSAIVLTVRGPRAALAHRRTWIGGIVLGIVNYASLLFLVLALGEGALPASSIFPLMNIVAILFATTAGITLFKERLSVRQWIGIACCITALVLIMFPAA
jgi:drug/metabolite transporter (DMT)-like permease